MSIIILVFLILSVSASFGEEDLDALLEDTFKDEIKSADESGKGKELQIHSAFVEAESVSDTKGLKIVQSGNCGGGQFISAKKEQVKYEIKIPAEMEYRLWIRYWKTFAMNSRFQLEIKQNGKMLISEKFGNFSLEKSENCDVLYDKYKLAFDNEGIYNTGFVTKGYNDFLWEYRDVKLTTGTMEVIINSKEYENKYDCIYITAYKKYNPKIDDMNKIWVRWKLTDPDDAEYYVTVSGANHTYNTWYFDFGHVDMTGHTKEKTAPKERDYIKSGEWSPWVKMPDINPSHHIKWDMGFGFAGVEFDTCIIADFEFSLLPGGGDICNVAKQEICGNNSIRVIMPRASHPNKRNEIFTHNQYLEKRKKHVADLSGGPFLKKIAVIGQCGIINPLQYVKDSELEIMRKAGVTLCGFGTNYENEKEVNEYIHAVKKNNFPIAGEMMHWMAKTGHVPLDPNDDFYAKTYKEVYAYFSTAKKPETYMKLDSSVRKLFIMNMGDEIGPSIEPAGIMGNTFYLQEYRKFLQKKGLTPEFFGCDSWKKVYPKVGLTTEEKMFNAFARRAFFETQEFVSYFTTMGYRAFTDGITDGFGKNYFVTANYQANPMQAGYMWGAAPDIFELGRHRGFSMQWTEDWTWNMRGIVFGVNLLRSSSQKHNQPYGGYLIDDCGNAKERFYAWAGWGSKVIYLYTYGPVYNYTGYTWEDDPGFMHDIANATREFAKAEDIIYDGGMKKSNVAIIYGKTDEVWGADWTYIWERMALFTTLINDNVQFDFIEEGDIIEDDKHKNYAVIYAPCNMMKESCQKKLKEWVRNGGTLVGIISAGMKNEYNENSDIMNEVFGLKMRYRRTTPSDIYVAKNSYFPEIRINIKELGQGAGTQLLADSAKPLAWFTDDSSPAITYNTFGKGRAFFFGFLPGAAYYSMHYKGCQWECGPINDQNSEYRRLATGMLDGVKDCRYFDAYPKGAFANMFASDSGLAIVFIGRFVELPENKFISADSYTVKVYNVGNVKSVETARGEKVDYRMEGRDLVVKFKLNHLDILIVRYK